MKVVNFTQGDKEWHEWRKNGIGASDIGVIMGSNKFRTPLQLWDIKCGYRAEDEINYAMAHGIKNEERAREWINNNHQLKLEPICVEDVAHPEFKASLDGYCSEHNTLAEIKCPVTDDILDKAREKQQIPMYWQHQIQWQIMLTNPTRAFIALWDYRYDSCITVECFAQPTLQKQMREKASEFWRMIQVGSPPVPSATDYIKVDDPRLKELLQEYTDHDLVEKAAEARKKEIKAQIVEFGDDGNFTAFGYYMTRCSARPTYDIEQMRMDGIDVEKYIKKSKSIGFYKICPPKN